MSHKDFWISILRRLQPTIKKAPFITWFQNTTVISKENGKMVVAVPTAYAETQLSQKYHVKILQAAVEIDATVTEVAYVVHTRLGEKENNEGANIGGIFSEELEKKVKKVRNQNEITVSKCGEQVRSRMLNYRYRLNNFISGFENRLPHAAASAVANSPGGIYNPLYIYGTTGLGKTHLLSAIGNEVLRVHRDKVIKYITAERFVSEVVEAISSRRMDRFKAQYRNVDCFLVDDVQFFARKDSSQQEFFHTFNELYDLNKQIVLTSDRPPSELQDLDGRLTSRFAMGMVVELLPPEFETRVAILQAKCQEYQIMIDPEVLSFIATNVSASVRELEGVLRQMVAETELTGRVPTIRLVAEIIKRLNKAQEIIGYDIASKRGQFMAKTITDVIKIVAEYFKLKPEDLIGKNRHREYMVPRQICMYLIKNELGQSYESIGVDFGGRNHTTVMHACTKTAQRLRNNLRLVKDINAIKREMGL